MHLTGSVWISHQNGSIFGQFHLQSLQQIFANNGCPFFSQAHTSLLIGQVLHQLINLHSLFTCGWACPHDMLLISCLQFLSLLSCSNVFVRAVPLQQNFQSTLNDFSIHFHAVENDSLHFLYCARAISTEIAENDNVDQFAEHFVLSQGTMQFLKHLSLKLFTVCACIKVEYLGKLVHIEFACAICRVQTVINVVIQWEIRLIKTLQSLGLLAHSAANCFKKLNCLERILRPTHFGQILNCFDKLVQRDHSNSCLWINLGKSLEKGFDTCTVLSSVQNDVI